jgi:protein-disulfide isomerase
MKRFTKTMIATTLALVAIPTFAATATTTNSADTARIQAVVKDYLVKNPEVIVEALQVLQKRQYEQAEQTVKKTQQAVTQFAGPLFNTANDPVAGNPTGKVTVVEFFDYQCPHCVDMAPVIAGIIKANPEVRIVFKDFPIRGPMSDFAARAALAANKQGKYYDFSHAVLTAKQPLTQESIIEMAKAAGLNIDKLKADMSDKSIDSQLQANVKLAQDLKLFGTPAFFIGQTGGKGNINYVPGQLDQAQLQAFIDKAGK